MDHGFHNLIYFDTRAREERILGDSDSQRVPIFDEASPKTCSKDYDAEIEHNIRALLSAFPQVFLCRTATSCLQRLDVLQSGQSHASTVVVISTSPEKEEQNSAQRQARSPSPRSIPGAASHVQELDGLSFLRHVVTEKRTHHNLSHVTPVIMLESGTARGNGQLVNPISTPDRGRQVPNSVLNQQAFMSNSQYLGLGAVDVLQSPLSAERAQSLPAHAYKTSQEAAKGETTTSAPGSRKTSWVGVNESKPFAYLRESMVSGLMDRICDPDYPEKPIDPSDLHLPSERKAVIDRFVGTWNFSAHDYSDDELLWASYLILKHTLSMPGVEKWRISDDEMLIFLMSCRQVYNSFVIYHNFRHACDVLQATFCFLIRIGAIPPYPSADQTRTNDATQTNGQVNGGSHAGPNSSSEISGTNRPLLASIIRPFEAMTLIISAIGHDVGHPGVNNLFLITLNAPLAQLYNDRSVLESFHCAAFSQILRRYWPAAFSDIALRKLLINSILATDMSVHGDYIKSLDKLNADMAADSDFIAKLEDGQLNEHRTLVCCLVIKCADISNVARQFSVAAQWADILTDEFANQANMESELDMPSCLFGGPPVLNDTIKMGSSQVGFMTIFGFPLFQKVSVALPNMKFTVDQLESNKATWQRTMDEAKRKAAKDNASITSSERTQSPFQTRRGSTIMQSQMRSDPMVFGSHSTMSSPPPPRKQSGGSHSQISTLNFNNNRRASLGPTVIPTATGRHSPNSGSRRSSGSHGRFASRIPDTLGPIGAGSGGPTTMTTNFLLPQIDGASDGLRTSRSTSAVAEIDKAGIAAPAVQELLSNPPPFVTRDPHAPSSGSADMEAARPRGGGETSPRGRETSATDEEDASSTRGWASGGESPRSARKGRKFSLRFWRKSSSLDGDKGPARSREGS